MQNEDSNKGWPINFGSFERPSHWFSVPICVIAILLFVTLVGIAVLAVLGLFAELLSGDQKRFFEAVKTALPLVAAAIGLPLIVWRLRILDRQTKISEDKTQIDRETHYTSIFSRSVEQLGQTREVKTQLPNAPSAEPVTRTVPNIEVRLGGIHSLARLAEESDRDRAKIENVLRSYIRENSWSDRNGNIISRPNWPRHSPSGWIYADDLLEAGSDSQKERTEWISKIRTQVGELRGWTENLPETRVDVNESADALGVQKPLNESIHDRPLLYECIFVGRRFNAPLLASVNFRRCLFVRCDFHFDKIGAIFLGSQFLDCTVNAKNSSIAIEDCQLSNVRFRAEEASAYSFAFCEAYSIRILGSPEQLSIDYSNLLACRISGTHRANQTRITNFSTLDATFVDSNFDNLKLSASSQFHLQVSSDIKLDRVDLSEVSDFAEDGLLVTHGTRRTIHPTSRPRPPAWPKYAPQA